MPEQLRHAVTSRLLCLNSAINALALITLAGFARRPGFDVLGRETSHHRPLRCRRA